jgi:hypothetical protein
MSPGSTTPTSSRRGPRHPDRDHPSEGKAKGRPHRGRPFKKAIVRWLRLAAEPQALDQRAVTRDVDVLEVAEQTAALTDHEEQTTTRVVVVLVLLQVL